MREELSSATTKQQKAEQDREEAEMKIAEVSYMCSLTHNPIHRYLQVYLYMKYIVRYTVESSAVLIINYNRSLIANL